MIDRRRHSPIHRLTLLLLVTSLLAPSVGIGSAAFADYWPGWRGDGSGVSPETSLPHTWSPTDNVLWAAAIPGDGLSSPIVWRDRVFLTTAGYESDWHLDTFVLLAFLSVLVPCVLCSYLRSPFPDPPRYATRIRPLTRGLLLIITFIAIACLIPIALDHVRARFPTLSVRLTGKPWHHSNELSRHIRTDAFLAGFLAVFAVLCLRPSPGRSPVLATLPPSRRQRFSVSALLLWLQCLCIIAMAGAFLAEKTRFLAISLFVFVIISTLQFLVARRHRTEFERTPLSRSAACRLLNCLRSCYVLGMASTFLIATYTYVMARPVLAPVPTWFQTADICSIGLIAAIGSFHPRSTARILALSLILPLLTLCILPPLLSHTWEDWWDSLRDARFEVYWAITAVSCVWFAFEGLQASSSSSPTDGEESRRFVVAPRAAHGMILAVIAFAVFTNFFPPNAVLQRQVVCIDRNDGTLLWTRRCASGGTKTLYSGERFATPSPVTDGRYLYAHFGEAGTYCLDYAGQVVWCHHEPVAPPPYGFTSSPVLWRDLLVVTYDTTTTSFTLALDKLTGEPRWKADRTSLIHSPQGELLEGYSTPIILEHAGRHQLVNHAGYYLSGYDLPTGNELWHFQCASYAVVVTPVSWKDVIIVGGASNATRSRCFQAVQLTQESDSLSATALWRARRNFPDVSTPVVYGEHVYTVTNKGIAACLEANTGKVCWTERLNGNYEASLVAGDRKLFFCNVEGETTVVAAGPEFKVLSQNAVREPVRASFAISGCRIFIRGDRHLFCIGGNA